MLTTNERIPLVGIPCDVFARGQHPFHGVGERYIDAVAHGAQAMPLLLPATGAGRDQQPLDGLMPLDVLLDMLDGLFLPGSLSNVAPARYGGSPSAPGTLHDLQRDATTLALIPQAIARGVPLLCVCRGIQELNVALGGTLYQHVQEVPGKSDHRPVDDPDRECRYGFAHEVEIEPGGMLEELFGPGALAVNSLHAQGIDRLAPRLRVEARAPDGLIEAVSVRDASAFALGVQWHPEWRFRDNTTGMKLFAAFGAAVRSRHRGRVAVQPSVAPPQAAVHCQETDTTL